MIIPSKFDGYAEGGRVTSVRRVYDSGGSSAPSTQTQIADIPDWAKPYAQETLEKTKALTAGPYQAYGAPRIAGFSPMQLQAQEAAAQMGPSQLGQFGGRVAGAASLGALGTQYDPFRMGQFTAGRAAQYMNPFVEMAMEPQLREAQRSSEMQRMADQAQAVRAGAFGGGRQAIVEAERQRNLGTQLGDIRARGYMSAFDQAQQQFAREQQLREQSRQYGAGLGMQGLQTALQGAGQLGALGGQEFGQQKEAIGLQSQLGAQQQALRQQGLTQAYQDFLNEQNYPYKQLGFMSDMIRGLPLGQQSTKQIYEPPGSMLGQIAGLGVGLGGMARFGQMFAEGGQVDGYADGGSVTSRGNVENILDDLSEVQLQQSRLAALNRGDQARLELIDQELAERASLYAGLGGAFDSLPAEDQERVFTAAGGGIVAFANGGAPFVQPLEEEESLAASRVSKKTRPAPRARTRPSAPNPSIAQAVEQMADKVGVNRETFLDKFEQLRNEFNASNKEEMKSILAEAEKTMGGSREVKERAFGEALANFGFQMARAAAKPGAKFLGSVSEAAPTLATSLAESAKLAREMDQNDMKLRLNMKQFEIAQRKGDMQTAAALAGQIRADTQAQAQLGLQRDQLAETIRANKVKEGIAARRASGAGSALQKAYMAGMGRAQDRAARIAEKNWNNVLTQQELKNQGYKTFDQYYEALVRKEMKRAVPISGVTPDDQDED